MSVFAAADATVRVWSSTLAREVLRGDSSLGEKWRASGGTSHRITIRHANSLECAPDGGQSPEPGQRLTPGPPKLADAFGAMMDKAFINAIFAANWE